MSATFTKILRKFNYYTPKMREFCKRSAEWLQTSLRKLAQVDVPYIRLYKAFFNSLRQAENDHDVSVRSIAVAETFFRQYGITQDALAQDIRNKLRAFLFE